MLYMYSSGACLCCQLAGQSVEASLREAMLGDEEDAYVALGESTT